MTRFPVFELVQPGADGLKDHPALKTVGGVGREQEAAVSGQKAPTKIPEPTGNLTTPSVDARP